jgi:ABC-type spermidine/putrescine transport system permease subunit I
MKGYTRLVLIAIWAVLFVAYISVFTTRLQKWDYEVPSYCYQAATARSNARHPYVDNIYIAITCLFIVVSYSYALALSLNSQLRQLKRNYGGSHRHC